MTKPIIQILMIEDSEADALLLKEAFDNNALTTFDFTISEFLAAGIEKLRQLHFDAVLLDLGLPDSQGLETFQKLHEEFPHIPVVVLSGLKDERLALEAVQSGAQDYLVKGPTGWEIAPRAIRYAIERQQSQTALRESEERFRTLIEQSSEGIALVDEEGKVLEWNQALEQITGISREQAVHLPVWEVQLQMVPPEQRSSHSAERIKAMFSEIFETGNPPYPENRSEIEIQTATGERKVVTQTIFVIKTARGYRLGSIVLDITERKRAEEALMESEDRYRLFFDTSIDAVFVTNPDDGSILAANPAACQMFGQTEEELLELGRNSLIDLSDPRLKLAMEERARKGHFKGELNFLRKDGIKFPGEISSALYKNKDGRERASLIIRDITERKLAEERLNQSENRYRLATKATNDVIWEWNAKTHQLLWTENAQVVFGFSPDEIGPDETWWDEHIHPDDHERVLSKLNALIDGDGSIWSEEYRFLLKDGSYTYISDHAYIEREADGKPLRMIGAMSNITERKRAEAAIQRRNAELTALNQIGQALNKLAEPAEIFELVFEGIGQVLDNRNLYIALIDEANQTISFPVYLIKGERIQGRQRPLSNGITDYILRNNRPVFFTRNIEESLGKLGINRIGIPSQSFLGVPMRAGDKVIGVIAVQDYEQENVYDEHHLELMTTIAAQATVALENARLYSAIQQELEERRQAEKKLRQSEDRYRRIVETANEGIIALDASWRISFTNARITEILGYAQDEMLGLHIDQLVFDDHRDDLERREALPGQSIAGIREKLYRTKNGAPAWMLLSIAPMFEEGKFAGAFIMATDITERKQAEEAVRRSEEQYRLLFENAPVGILSVTTEGQITEVNTAALHILGSPSAEATKSINILTFPPLVEAGISADFQACIENGRPVSSEHAYTTKWGKPIFIKYQLTPVLSATGNIILVQGILEDITERKQAESALLESFARFRTLFEASPDAIMLIDPQGNWPILDCNSAACAMNGYTREELIGQSIDMLNLKPGDKAERQKYLDEIKMAGVLRMESLHRRKDGSIFPVDISTCMITLDERQVVLGIDRDITERKRAVRLLTALNRSAQAMAGVLTPDEVFWAASGQLKEVGLDCIILPLDKTGDKYVARYLSMAPELLDRLEGLTGIKHENFSIPVGAFEVFQRVRLENRTLLVENIEPLLRELLPKPLKRLASQIAKALHTPKYIAAPMMVDNTFVGIFAVQSQDLTEKDLPAITAFADQVALILRKAELYQQAQNEINERKQAEEALRVTNEALQAIIHAAPIGIVVLDPDGNVKLWSPTNQHIFGWSESETLGNFLPYVPEDKLEEHKALRQRVLQGEAFTGVEACRQRKDGTYVDISISTAPLRDGQGNITGILGLNVDITQRKRMEQALLESEERFRSLYNNATIGLYRTTPDGRVLMCNPAAVRMLGFDSFDELIERNLEEEGFEPDYPRHEFREKMERDGKVIGLESKWTKKDGTSINVRESATAVRDSQGKIIHYDGTFEDITEWKRAEEALRASEKKFKTLFEIAPVGISVLDQAQNIIDANYSLQTITGLKKNKLVNRSNHKRTYLRPDGTVMSPDEFASTRALKENMPIFDIETGIVTDDRGVVWTQVSAAPLDMPDASLVVITQDISERKQAEGAMRHRLAELETLYESGLALNQLLEPKEIGQKIISVLSEKLDWNHTTIRQYHLESEELELLAYNIAGINKKKEWQRLGEKFKTLIARPGDGFSGWAVAHGESVRCGDVLRDPRYIETIPDLRSGLYVPIMAGGRAIGVISVESEKPDYFTPEDEHLVATLAAQAAVALENIRLFRDLQASNEGLLKAYDKTIEGWSHALDLRDKETEGHTQRVTALTEELAREMGIPDPDLIYIRWGALLHDIGKMGVPDRILLKPDKLTDDEWVIMRQHPVHAHSLLSQIDFLEPALNIPHYHHEKWDGTGYPDSLQREQIPLEARIFAVIDVFDALTSDRPYRPAWPKDMAISYICEQAGSHFDPQVVDAFVKLINGR